MTSAPTSPAARQPTEAELQEILAVGEQYRAQLDQLESQRGYLQQVLTDYTQGHAALTALKTAKVGDEVLIPVGGGVFVRANLAQPERVLTSLGSALHADASVDEALARVAERIQNLERTQERLGEEATRVAGEVARVNAFLQQMAGR